MNNRGSVVIEMCFVAPILVGVMFVVINMLILAMNPAVTEGEMYSVLYNKEEYYISKDGNGNTDMVNRVIEQNLSSDLSMVNTIDVNACMSENGSGGLAAAGSWNVNVSYEEDIPGEHLLIKDDVVQKSVSVSQEIRNTASNLRRWQAYGELLSD